MLKFVDVASYQGNYKVGSYGEEGVIVKATEGTSYVNPNCDFVAQQCIAQRRPWALYHYASGTDAKAEANYFVNNIKGYLNSVHKPALVLDWEGGGNAAWGNGNWAKVWIDEVKRLTGVQPGIYTGQDGVNQTHTLLSKESWLWFVGYPTMADTGWETSKFLWNIGSWASLTGWQFSSTPLDKSIFYLDVNAWNKLTVGNSKPTPPPAPNPTPSPNGKNLEEMASIVQSGGFGSGDARKKALGKYYNGVQAIVNERAKAVTAQQCHNVLLSETKKGVYGNNPERQRLLGNYYETIQNRINRGE